MRGSRSNGRSGGSSTATYGGSHAKAAADEWPAVVALLRPLDADADGAFDGERTTFGDTTPEPYLSEQPARIQVAASMGDRPTEVAEDDVVATRYLIQLLRSIVTVQVGDVVRVDANDEDPATVDRFFRVGQIVVGSEIFTRDLFCTLLERGGA